MVGRNNNMYGPPFSTQFHRSAIIIILTLEEKLVVLGEIANFAAYAFAPAILVTPLGALSVLIGYEVLLLDPGTF